jgi:hypothetical protein
MSVKEVSAVILRLGGPAGAGRTGGCSDGRVASKAAIREVGLEPADGWRRRQA